MVSYYNTLSSMFPSAHHPGAQPHPIASGRHGSAHSPAVVAAAAAQSASAYLHGYHPSAAAAYHQQFAAAASAGHHQISNAAAAAAAAAQYSDLNSNMYTGSSALATSPTQFQDGIPSSHQPSGMGHTNGNNSTSWHANSVWHSSPQFNALQTNDGRATSSLADAYGPWTGPTSTPSLLTTSSSVNNVNSNAEDSSSEVQNSSVSDSGGGQGIVQSTAASTSDQSPPTPTGCDSAPSQHRTLSSHPPPQDSPGANYAPHSHSSGSPSATPTPGLFSSQQQGNHAQQHRHEQDQQNDSGVFSKYSFQHSPGFMTKSEMTSPPGKPHVVSSAVGDYLGGSSDPDMHGTSGFISSHAGLSPSSLSPPSSRPQPARSPYEWMKKPSYQSQPEKNGRTRTKDKYRIVYSDHQRLELEKEFHYSRYITIRRKAELANSVGLSERQVKIWFQNRRAKERRALKKQEDTLVKEKIDSSAVAVHAMSAFTDSITAAHQYNNGSAIATAAGQMAIGMPHGVPGNPHVSSANGFPTHSMMSTPPFGMSMKFE